MRPIVLKGTGLDAAKILRAVENGLDAAAKGAQTDFRVTTRTWNHKPDFNIERSPGRRVVATDDDIYFYLDEGTRVRYATMTANFRPKSRVRFIGSNIGRGGVLFISRKRPRPGIKAREFSDVIHKKWDRELPLTLQRAINAEVK